MKDFQEQTLCCVMKWFGTFMMVPDFWEALLSLFCRKYFTAWFIKKSNNIDLKKYIVTLPPVHVPLPQNPRKDADTEAWLSEQEQNWRQEQEQNLVFYLNFGLNDQAS